MEYIHLLQDPRWQKKRLKIFERDNWTCRRCSDDKTNLQVHHLYYSFGLEPWDYPNEALITLCQLCHKKAEFMKWALRYGVVELRKLGFPDSDIEEIKDIVFRNIGSNHHKESAERYMEDIKTLCHG